ncbi:unnamed protein product [Knipowitschia caucasica]
MAAKYIYQNGFLLLLFNFISTAALEKRFSDLKRCADEECSMLLVRGKALDDFRGPDCRFLNFKKSETIYVYYKLAGRRADMWAGSVGSSFGYFPKDLLSINHIYTEKEIEIPAEETDFVCFETGFDKFQSYDVDYLLGFLNEDSKDQSNATSSHVSKSIQMDTKPPEEDDNYVPDEQNVSPNETELSPSETLTTPDTEAEGNYEPQVMPEPTVDEVVVEPNETKESFQHVPEEENLHRQEDILEPSVTLSENAQIPELKTSHGTTFDAVVTGEATTVKTTPEEEETQEEIQVETQEEPAPELPLLTADIVEEQAEIKADESMWSSFGDAVFSVVTGGEKAMHEADINSDEEEDDDDDEEIVAPPKTFEEIKADKQPLDIKYPSIEAPRVVSKPEDGQEMVQEVNDEPKSEAEEHLFEIGDVVVGPDEAMLKRRNVLPTIETANKEESTQDEALPTQENLQFQTNGSDVEQDEEEPTQEEALPTQENIEFQNNGGDVEIVEEEPTEEEALPTQEDFQFNKNSSDVELDGVVNVSNGRNDTTKAQDSHDVVKPADPLDENTTKSKEKLPAEKAGLNVFNIVHNLARKSKKVHSKLDNNDESVKDEPMDEDVDVTMEIIEEIEPDLKEVEVELLEDENALSSQMGSVENTEPVDSPNVPEIVTPEDGDEGPLTSTDDPSETSSPEMLPVEPTPEPEPVYSDDVMRLSILREHFSEEKMARCQKYLGLTNLFKLEAMFEDLETELQATRQSHRGSVQDIENALERILEASENAILDEVEKILDSRESKYSYNQQVGSNIDEETEILDDFQELAFSLRRKYSTASDSAPLAKGVRDNEPDELNVKEAVPVILEDADSENSTDLEEDVTLTSTHPLEQDTKSKKPEGIILDQVPSAVPDVSVEEDVGHFNKNQDNQQSFEAGDKMPKVPQATLESPLDMGLGVEVENSPSGTLESLEPPSEFHEDDVGLFSTALVYLGCIAAMCKSKTTEWATAMIASLPDEWRPGDTLLGCPWEAVGVTAVVGILTFTLFFWRTVLAVKKREYLVDHKKLDEQIVLLKKEKDDALVKITELQKQSELLKENQKESAVSATTAQKKLRALQKRVSEAEMLNQQSSQEKQRYIKQLEEERTSSQKNETRIEKLERSIEKLQQSRKKTQEALAKTTVLLDEAKIREDARHAQQKSLEKDYTASKKENNTLKLTIKNWEDTHRELSEKIKVYQKSQKELEDSLAQKDHNIEVLSDLLSDLEACDVQKADPSVSANRDMSVDKTTAIKNRIQQMMDVSRVQTTLSVVEEERDRFMSKLHAEEKARKSLEEQHQELEHAIATIKSEKSLVENQYKVLQQKNEIIVEMYQQKESALQQRLTKEEMERRSKESMLTEVGGKATEAEEQVRVLRQRINEMEEQMRKTEEMYKEQIKEQENKTHSNWITARNAERALNQEKVEASKLREKLTVLTSQLNEKRAPLFRPNSGQFPGPRQGPRPPSDPHGRYAESKHMSGLEMLGPRNSSPANMDAPIQAEGTVSSESPEPGPGSFIVSPIKDCPDSGPPPHEHLLPPGRLPPPGAYRPMRPGPYPPGPGPYPHPPPGALPPHPHGPLPANGHPGMPMGGDFGPRPSNGHAFQPRPGPVPMDLRGPPPPHMRPPPYYGPMPPPHVLRGPMGPHQPFPPDMRYPGPRGGPPLNMPRGVPPPGALPPHSGPYAPPDSFQSTGAHSNTESPDAAAGAEP